MCVQRVRLGPTSETHRRPTKMKENNQANARGGGGLGHLICCCALELACAALADWLDCAFDALCSLWEDAELLPLAALLMPLLPLDPELLALLALLAALLLLLPLAPELSKPPPALLELTRPPPYRPP